MYTYRNTQPARCAFHKSFKLLSSHTNIPLTKKVCRLSETQKILEENVFFFSPPELFIYFSFPPPRPHNPGCFHLLRRWLISRISGMSDFFICCQRRRQGRDLAQSHSNIQSILQFAIYHSQTDLWALQQQQQTNTNPDQSVFCNWKQQVNCERLCAETLYTVCVK